MAEFSHLLVNLRPGQQLQVLQVRVEQAAAGQRDPQNRLDDVADGAVVGQADLLGRVHEVATAGKTKKKHLVRGEDLLESCTLNVFSLFSIHCKYALYADMLGSCTH